MTRCCRIFTFLAALLFMGSVAWAQSSGNFTYGTGSTFTGDTACVLESNGNITGGQQCFVSTNGSTNTPCSGASQDAADDVCEGIYGVSSGVKCSGTAVGSTCVLPIVACTTTADCSTITGATRNNPTGGALAGFCQVKSGTCIGEADAALKTNSGNGNVFVVRPSAVIGLLTDVTVSEKQVAVSGSVSSSALAGIDFQVTASLVGGTAPQQPNVIPSGLVTYDARFVQITTNLFQAIAGLCTGPLGCFFTFNESTVSAHSFDWIIGAPRANGTGTPQSGEYNLAAKWQPSAGFGVAGIAEALACVGPVNMTAA